MKRTLLNRFLLLTAALISIALVAAPRDLAAETHGAAPAKKASSHDSKASKPKAKAASNDHSATTRKKSRAAEDTESSHNDEASSQESKPAQPLSVRVVLVLDSSRSMMYTDPKNLRNQAARLFVRFLQPGDEIAILRFDSSVHTVLPLTAVTQETIPSIDAAIEGIKADGNFTDLEQPLEASLKILNDARPNNSVYNVVLLSDGTMDPKPSRGTAAELTKKALEEDLPKFTWQSTRLFTLALGEHADAELLQQMAEATGGKGWSARDVDTVHAKFSELFLSIKKPVVATVEKGGFAIDGSAEATFYLSRKGAGAQVSLVDPLGKKLSLLDLPPNVRWYKGDLFDLITIARPLAGKWKVLGGDNPEEFVTLLNNIKLEVEWPEKLSHVDQEFKLEARLVDGDHIINVDGIKAITDFTYRIAEDGKGVTIAAGDLRDDGKGGDHEADDGIYSTTLSVSQAGKFALIVGASSPTFSRFQQLPITLGHEPLSLAVETTEHDHVESEKFVVKLSHDMAQLEERSVKIVAQGKESDEEFTLIPDTIGHDGDRLEASTAELVTDEYEAYASVTGFDSRGKKISQKSEVIHFSANNTANAETAEALAQSRTLQHTIGFAFFLLSLLTGAFLWRRFVLPFAKLEALPPPLPPFSHDPTLLEQISVIRTNSSESKRAPDSDERELFALVKDILPAVDPASQKAGAAQEAARPAAAAGDSPPSTEGPADAQAAAAESGTTHEGEASTAASAATQTPQEG